MANYTTIKTVNEDIYGMYYVHIRISNVYTDIFDEIKVFETINNLSFDSISNELEGDNNAVETQSINLEINEYKNTTDFDAAFTLEALLSAAGTGDPMYFGVYVTNSLTPSFDIGGFAFIGKLVNVSVKADSISSETIGDTWDFTLGKSIYKIDCENYQENIVRNLSTLQMIESTQFINLRANTAYNDFRQGYYLDTSRTAEQWGDCNVSTGKLIDLNVVLNEIGKYIQDNTDIDIIEYGGKVKCFDVLPARWKGKGYYVSDTVPPVPSYCDYIAANDLRSKEALYVPSFRIKETEKQSLYLNLNLDDYGSESYKNETIWLSEQVVFGSASKNTNNQLLDFDDNSQKNYSFLQYKNVYDLLFAIAENLDLILQLSFTDYNKIKIEFVNKADYVKVRKYFKNATNMNIEATNEIDEENDNTLKPYYGRAFAIADEGYQVYLNRNIVTITDDTETAKKKGNRKLLFTISPCEGIMWTEKGVFDGLDYAAYAKYPHNHSLQILDNPLSVMRPNNQLNNLSITTAIFMYVDKSTEYSGLLPMWNSKTPDNYWTLAACIIENNDTIPTQYDRMDDYLNRHYLDQVEDFASNLEIDVPFIQMFSTSNVGTDPHWYQIVLGDLVGFGTNEFVIISIERNFTDLTTKLKCTSSSAFTAYDTFTGIAVEDVGEGFTGTPPEDWLSTKGNYYLVNGNQNKMLYMVNSDNNAVKFINNADNYNLIIGFWTDYNGMPDPETGLHTFIDSGLYSSSLFSFLAMDFGLLVFAKQLNADGLIEYTLTPYVKDTFNDMLVCVGVVYNNNTIDINITNELFITA